MSSSPPCRGDLSACLERMSRGVAMRSALMTQTGKPLPYAQPLTDAVALFESLGIAYALIGGVASMYYGRSRFTEDIDFVAVAGHRELLANNPDAMRAHHFDLSCTRNLYHHSGVEIDIWKDEHADAMIQGAKEIDLAGRTIRIADPHDLIAMKLRAARLQDDYDVSEILRGTPIDDDTVRSRVTPGQFAHYLSIRQRTRP